MVNWSKLGDMDRRWIWLFMFIIMIAVLMNPIGLPITLNPHSQQVHDYITTNIGEGDYVWIATEYEGASTAELNPELVVLSRMVMQQGARIVYSSTFGPTAPFIVADQITPVAAEYGYEYGTDWINLGYKPGEGVAIQGFTNDIRQTSAGVDYQGRSLDQFPILEGVNALTPETFSLIAAIETGSPGCPEWLQYGATPSGVPMMCGTLTMSIAESKPYVDSGQYVALVQGNRGAAELELRIQAPGQGAAAQDAQSLSGLYLTLMIIIGNIAYMATRREATP